MTRPTPTQPHLAAELILDDDGRPRCVEDGQRRHYAIELRLEGAPPDAASVTYRLDPSYWDPLREVRRAPGPAGSTFSTRITSCGDFEVVASLSGSRQAGRRLSARLSELLRASVDGVGERAAIERALDDLAGRAGVT